MDDLISRQAAIDALELTTWYHQNRNGEMVEGANDQEHQAWYKAEDVYKVLNNLPSAQPEIIRCKDCGHRDPFYGSCSEYDDVMMPPEHFCSFAVKRIDNG